MSPVKYKIIHKKIHPPEADALADSYAKAARSALSYTDELNRIAVELDSTWDGNQKTRFLDSFRSIGAKSRQYADGTLPGFEKQFRMIQVEVEEQVLIDPR
jgi:uncharacterized protein YukE